VPPNVPTGHPRPLASAPSRRRVPGAPDPDPRWDAHTLSLPQAGPNRTVVPGPATLGRCEAPW